MWNGFCIPKQLATIIFTASFLKTIFCVRFVTGRRPFGEEPALEYEYDSDDDWEDEGEGESLSDAEDEKEEEDDYEVSPERAE